MRRRNADPSSDEHLPEGYDDPDGDWFVPPEERHNYRRDPAVEAVLAADPAHRRSWLTSRGYSEDAIRNVRRTASGGWSGVADPTFVINLDNDELDRFGHAHARQRARAVLEEAARVKREEEAERVRRETLFRCHICGEMHDDTARRRPVLGQVWTGDGGWQLEVGDEIQGGASCTYALWSERVEQP